MKKPTPRKFTDSIAKREQVPLQIGIVGPSGCGKTFSSLRLGNGMAEVLGGDLWVIDTEHGRSKEYADVFRFRRVDFAPPHGSLDYLEAMQYCVDKGAKVIVVDSMSHEHNGVGGMLEQHEHWMEVYGAGDEKVAERNTMRAWAKVKPPRNQLIQRMVQMPVYFILNFWAKETTRPVLNPLTKKTEMVAMGFQPIAGDEFVYFMTVRLLLPPGAAGVPDWSEAAFKGGIPKLGDHLKPLFPPGKPLDETMGKKIASWALGDAATRNTAERTKETAKPAVVGPGEAATAGDGAGVLAELERVLREAAATGTAALQLEWKDLHRKYQKHFQTLKDETLKPLAIEADRRKTQETLV